MTEAFDAYRRWLGIPPAEQPPHHYRLLGIALFESDADVIQEAADRQMAHVQTHKTGQHSALSQKLLNELSSAKLTLLNVDRRANYDQALKKHLAAQEAKRQAAKAQIPQALPVAVAIAPAKIAEAPIAVEAFEPETTSRRAKSKSRKPAAGGSKNLIFGGAVVAVLLVIGGVWMAMGGDGGETKLAAVNQPTLNQDPPKDPGVRTSDPEQAIGASETTEDTDPAEEPEPTESNAEPAKTATPVTPTKTNSANNDPAKLVSTTKGGVDLLKLIDTQKHAYYGPWKVDSDGSLVSPTTAPGRHARLQIPYIPPADYTIEMVVERKPKADVALGAVVAEHQVQVLVDGWGETISGLHMVDNKMANVNEAVHKGRVLTSDKKEKLVYTVRGNHLTLEHEGKKIIDWQGDPKRLGAGYGNDVPDRRVLYLVGYGAGYRISELKLYPATTPGKAVALAPLKAGPVEGPLDSELYKRIAQTGPVVACAVANDRQFAVTSDAAGNVRLWKLNEFKQVAQLRGHDGIVSSVCYSPDNTTIFTAGHDGTVRMWEAAGGKLIGEFAKTEGKLLCMSISNDGRFLAAGGEEKVVHVWNVPTEQEIYSWNEFSESVTDVAVSPDGKRVLAACGCFYPLAEIVNSPDHTVHVLNLKNDNVLESKLTGHAGGIVHVGFLPNGQAISAGYDHSVRVWDLNKSVQVGGFQIPDGYVTALAAAKDGRFIYVGVSDQSWRAWEIKTGRFTMTQKDLAGQMISIAPYGDSHYVLAGMSDNSARVWRLDRSLHVAQPKNASPTGDTETPNKTAPKGNVVKLKPPVNTPNETEMPAERAAPSEEEQQTATKLVKEIFADEFKAAKKPADKVALAEKLLAQAETSQTPSERFALLSEASDLAADGGSAALLGNAIAQLTAGFVIDTSESIVKRLEHLGKQNGTPATKRELVDAALPLVEGALASENFDLAKRILAIAGAAARKTNDAALVKQITTRLATVTDFKKQHDAADVARKTLAESPDDPAANLVVGKYLCLVKGDWPAGLPMLVKGDNPKLADVAGKELTNPDKPDQQARLGDLWWDLGDTGDAKEKALLQARAETWYQQALPGLKGLSQTKIERRLQDLADARGGDKASSKPNLAAIVKGGPTKAPPTKGTATKGTVTKGTATKGTDTTGDNGKAMAARLKAAVKKNNLVQSPIGGGNRDRPFTDVPTVGALLGGFNYCVLEDEGISSLQPIYLKAKGTTTGLKVGTVVGRSGSVMAKKGYAVGSITVSGSYTVSGFEVTFMKIDGDKLDPKDTYTSGWIGENYSFRRTLGGDGQPVVGIYGYGTPTTFYGFGLVQLPNDTAAAKP